MTRRRRRSTSATTPSRCRRASWRRSRRKDPLDILAYQYDIVCNGVELSLGRDPQPPAGHHVQGVRDRRLHAGGGRHQLLRHDQRLQVRRAAAWRLGARASTGSSCCSPASPISARSSLFPMNQKAEDLMMNAPGAVTREAAARAHHPRRGATGPGRQGPGEGRCAGLRRPESSMACPAPRFVRSCGRDDRTFRL